MTPHYKRCPPGWEALESEEAKRLRGKRWSTFARTVPEERGRRCRRVLSFGSPSCATSVSPHAQNPLNFAHS